MNFRRLAVALVLVTALLAGCRREKEPEAVYGNWYSPRFEEDAYTDSVMTKFIENFRVPGATVAIMRGEELLYAKGYGYVNLTDSIPAGPDNLFRVASISKSFCALCVMNLLNEGLLDSLDQKVFGPVGILGKEFPNVKPNEEKITVRHLLQHSGGLCAAMHDVCFTNKIRFTASGKPLSSHALIRYALDHSNVRPGLKYWYSNIGFVTLHRVVETLSGMPYEDYLEKTMAKVGATDTHIGGGLEARRENETFYYDAKNFKYDRDGYKNPLASIKGAAGVVTSVRQMMMVLAALDGSELVPELLPDSIRLEMFTPSPTNENYGLGWRLTDTTGRYFRNAHFHCGDLSGSAVMWLGGSTGDCKTGYSAPMSGAILCNSRTYRYRPFPCEFDEPKDTVHGIFGAFYGILSETFHHFNEECNKQ